VRREAETAIGQGMEAAAGVTDEVAANMIDMLGKFHKI
jgi:hypothetical protein